MIYSAPDYIPITFVNFLSNFFDLFTKKEYPNFYYLQDHVRILGYSCRSLFHTLMEHYKKDDLTVVTTPLHHTSFRNIIELCR